MRPLPPDDVFRRLVRVRASMLAAPGAATQLELARQAGLSRFHFVRRWREAFGVTPHEDVTRARIARAKELLRAEALSVTEVCHELGFSSLGSFSTLFAARAGCAPSAWRRRWVQVTATLVAPSGLFIPYCFALRGGSDAS